MAFSEAFMSMPNSAFTWMAVFLVVAVAMYFGRIPAHAVILSLTRVHEDASAEHWGNLVIHEIAHKLDMQNGVANGMPPLHRDMSRARWTEVWSTTFSQLGEELDRGFEPWLGEYALEDPAEFFSAMSEAFFTCPKDLERSHADLYSELRRFYRQDPAAATLRT